MLEPVEVVMRLGAAMLAGGLLGLDRELEAKPIGIRTLALVSLGAASVCVAAINQPILDGHPDAISRVAQGAIQGVLAGIGFLGAGVVLQIPEQSRIKFLTSAATVWVTAALGVACGLGAWIVVGVATFLAMILLIVVKPLDDLIARDKARKRAAKHAQTPPRADPLQ